jgi:hypothetical protein
MNNDQAQVRDSILRSIRNNQPASRPMPQIPHFGVNENTDLVESFRQGVTRMAGVVISEISTDLDSLIRSMFPTAKVICSRFQNARARFDRAT